MKRLILVRHAKSDWPEHTEDFDRPLAERGLHDAARMSQFLKNQQISIDRLISSPAVRAFTTSEIFHQTLQTPMFTDEKLYQPTERNLLSVIHDIEDSISSVALFSHNNGISNFANTMTEDVFLFPTCGVAGFEINCTSWSEFEGAEKKLVFFYEPKHL
ncbi:SixA phosphatase family protein [Chryseobacterium sp. MFBS3-17]|uniref:SixA phosphatase family protein n=1 Tax=Chryseobacterium sp. MFBS3-17 TaxID=2886689 RepID=UPI001D0DFCD5|nr:histidine phosphatase family protein [Chryseobacterium sp. MFBS3-17]MCC2591090.1 histidine phosphatase family protein [Chryseobacterium sp. MFBS3-17]